MKFEIRPLISDADLASYKIVYEEVWRQGQPFAEGELDPGDGSSRYVAYQGGEPAAGFKVHHYAVNCFGATLRCAGVASVGVRPTFRGSGVGGSLMEWSLGAMRDEGFQVAALYPYREEYYRRFGYVTCGMRWQIRCPADRIPTCANPLPARRISADVLSQLAPCYDAFISDLNGANRRSPEQWRARMGMRPPMIYATGDPVEAYAWTSMEGGFWEDLVVGEFAWATERGYRSMLHFLRGLCVNRSALVWSEPSAGPFLPDALDQGVSISLHRPAMYRVLDPDCLAVVGLDPPPGLSIQDLTRALFPDPALPPASWQPRPGRSHCTEFF